MVLAFAEERNPAMSRPMKQIEFTVILTVPTYMTTHEAAQALLTCISFGIPVVKITGQPEAPRR
jgi:hypothetical protein